MVVIKGFKMPKKCLDCPMFDYGTECCVITENDAETDGENRAEDCPLAEVE